MRQFIAVGTKKDKVTIWDKHFGVSPIYSIFSKDGKLIEQRKNPYSNGKDHDNPELIVDFLQDADIFLAKNMGIRSKEKLLDLGISSFLTDKNNIFEAVNFYIEALKKFDIFDKFSERYEEWFDRNAFVYNSEIKMLKNAIPKNGTGVEIGVGSGRFAYPLGISYGVEPSIEMAKIAKSKGIEVYQGFAEKLPIVGAKFDFVLIAVTICFVNDPIKTIKEAYRILKKGGRIIIAIVDKNSRIGAEYLKKQKGSDFYKAAKFFSSEDIIKMMESSGFKFSYAYQTLFGDNIKSINEVQNAKQGYGKGGFAAIVGEKI